MNCVHKEEHIDFDSDGYPFCSVCKKWLNRSNLAATIQSTEELMKTIDGPELEDVRGWYIDGRRVHNPFAGNAALVALFDRWLAAHDERVRTEEREKALRDAYEAAERQVQLASLVAGRPSDFEKGVMSALAAIRAVSAEQEDHHD